MTSHSRKAARPRPAARPAGAGRTAPAEPAVVDARGLSVGYSAEAVCAPVDLLVRPGEVVALIGPNGAGKSTVLRAVLGLLTPLRGTLTVFGEPVDERSAAFRSRVAGVLDDDAWFP